MTAPLDETRTAGDRPSVTIGQRPEPFTIKDAGNPGDKVVWQVHGAAGRMENADAEIREDRTASGQFIPYGLGEAEVLGVVEGDFENAHAFRISILADPDSRPTNRPPAMTPPGVPLAWTSDFTDEEVDRLFSMRESDIGSPNEALLSDTRPTPVPGGGSEALREAPVPREAVVPDEPEVLREAAAPSERPAAKDVVADIVIPPANDPLTADERRSITGSRARRTLHSPPMIALLMVTIFVAGFGMIALLSGQNMTDREAIEDAARRTADLPTEAKKAPEPSVSVPTEPPAARTIDFGCSTAPIRANPDGTYEMEACVN